MFKKSTEVFVFGNTEYTPILNTLFKVNGIIDEITNAAEAHEIQIIALRDVPKDSVIINTVNNSRAYQAQYQLKLKGYRNTFFVGDIINQFPEKFQNTFLKQAQDAMKIDYHELKESLSIFSDQQSKDEFLDILNFRLSLDIEYLSHFDVQIHHQYFEYFLYNKKFDYLIDGGAYDGEDTENFVRHFPKYKGIYTVEPSKKNLEKAINRLANISNIEFVNACLGQHKGFAQISGDGTSTRTVSSGGENVEVITIDCFKPHGNTLVKLDIEGAEMTALNGAINSMKDPNYSFAISAYHLPSDIKNILNQLRRYDCNRKFYFRHYSNGIFESILFAV